MTGDKRGLYERTERALELELHAIKTRGAKQGSNNIVRLHFYIQHIGF